MSDQTPVKRQRLKLGYSCETLLIKSNNIHEITRLATHKKCNIKHTLSKNIAYQNLC